MRNRVGPLLWYLPTIRWKSNTQTQRASTPTPPNFILATLRDQRQATKSNEGCRHHHPAHRGVIARSNSAVNGLRLEFVRIFPTAGESRDSMYCWRSLGMDNNMGDDFVQCADFGLLLDRGRGGGFAKFSVFDRGLVWRMLLSGLITRCRFRRTDFDGLHIMPFLDFFSHSSSDPPPIPPPLPNFQQKNYPKGRERNAYFLLQNILQTN